MNTNIFFLIIIVAIKVVSNANILAVLPTPIRSHKSIFGAVIKVLADEHQITYYGPKLSFHHKNITEKDINIWDLLLKFSNVFFDSACKEIDTNILINGVLWTNYTYYDDMFKGEDIQELLKSDKKFDLMITIGHQSEHFFQLAHKFDIPLVHVAAAVPLPWTNEYIGNSNIYSTDISFVTANPANSLIQRIRRFGKHVLVMIHYKWSYLPVLDRIAQQYFPPNTPSIEEVAREKTALVLMNADSKMGYIRPNVPGVIEVGGLHCRPAKPLSEEFESFMESSGEHGVIYFSLGATVRGSVIPERIRKGIINVFKKLPQKVLWKWEDKMADLPPNVMISKWIPQQDILGHKKIRLFITQSGMLSAQESAYHGVPILAIPIILDQYTNAAVAVENGYGLQMDICQFNEEEFYRKIQYLLHNPRYALKAKNISAAKKDQMWSSEEKVKWWVKYILKHKNITLRATNNLSWIQYSEFDVHLTLITIIVISAYLLFIFTKFILSLVKITIKIKEKQY